MIRYIWSLKRRLELFQRRLQLLECLEKELTIETTYNRVIFDKIFDEWAATYKGGFQIKYIKKFQTLFFFCPERHAMIEELSRIYDIEINIDELFNTAEQGIPAQGGTQITLSQWVALAEWTYPQIAKTYLALGEDKKAYEVVRANTTTEEEASTILKKLKEDAIDFLEKSIYCQATSTTAVTYDENEEGTHVEKAYIKSIPPKPPPPRTNTTIVIGLGLGVALGLGWVVLKGWFLGILGIEVNKIEALREAVETDRKNNEDLDGTNVSK